jgi:HAD superfamily hydrolase (TIGR01509 family)
VIGKTLARWQQARNPRWRNLRGVPSPGAFHQHDADDGGRSGAVLFDLDGTLIDSVYQHVLAWRDALQAESIDLPVWGIHRKVGMSGGLFARALLRETGAPVDAEQAERLQRRHEDAFANYSHGVRPLPGARSLLLHLRELGVPWAIATSGTHIRADAGVDLLDVPGDEPLVTHDEVRYAKPDPDLFVAAAEGLGVAVEDSIVVGDSIWDLLAARRARALGVGLLSGGYGREELERAGAFRVYDDPADLLDHLDEIGVRDA